MLKYTFQYRISIAENDIYEKNRKYQIFSLFLYL